MSVGNGAACSEPHAVVARLSGLADAEWRPEMRGSQQTLPMGTPGHSTQPETNPCHFGNEGSGGSDYSLGEFELSLAAGLQGCTDPHRSEHMLTLPLSAPHGNRNSPQVPSFLDGNNCSASVQTLLRALFPAGPAASPFLVWPAHSQGSHESPAASCICQAPSVLGLKGWAPGFTGEASRNDWSWP